MRNKIKWLSKSLIIGLSALSVSAFADDTPKIKVEQVHKDLKNPWDMAFLDNDTMFFTEKCDGCKDNKDVCNGNIVMKFQVSEDFKSVAERNDIITDIQYKPFESDHPFGGPGAHNGAKT